MFKGLSLPGAKYFECACHKEFKMLQKRHLIILKLANRVPLDLLSIQQLLKW
jgi:hypothetical protein